MRFLVTIFILIISLPVFGQFPNNPTQSSVSTNNQFLGAVTAQKGLVAGTFTDTTAANAVSYIKTVPFIMISCTTPNAIYFRNATATGWVQLLPSGGGSGGGYAWNVGGNSLFNSASGNFVFGIGATTTGNYGIDFRTKNTTRLILDSNGIVRSSSAANVALLFDSTTKTLYYGTAGSGTGSWLTTGNTLTGSEYLGSNNSFPLYFKTNSAKRLTINTNGAFGLGTGEDYGTAGYLLSTNGSSTAPTWVNPSSLYPTWQQTLTAGSTLTGNNTIAGGGYDMIFNSVDSFYLNRGAQGPVATFNNGTFSDYLEFYRTGYTARASVGALGGLEANLSYNMNYYDDIHRYYDPTKGATWMALFDGGWQVQYAPTGYSPDIWDNSGKHLMMYQSYNGHMILNTDATTVAGGGFDGMLTVPRDGSGISIAGVSQLVVEGAKTSGVAGDIFLNAYNSGKVILGLGGGNVGIGIDPLTIKLYSSGTVRHASLGTASSDTTTYKPLGINSSGDLIGMTNWTLPSTVVTSVSGTANQIASTGGTTPVLSLVSGGTLPGAWNLGTPSALVVTNASGTASININGTVGATTRNTGAFTAVGIGQASTSIPLDVLSGSSNTAAKFIGSNGAGVVLGDNGSTEGSLWSDKVAAFNSNNAALRLFATQTIVNASSNVTTQIGGLGKLSISSATSTFSNQLAVSSGATTGSDLSITNSTLTTGSAASIALTGTAAASNTKTGLTITSSGANATASQTVTGQTISVTNTGTTNINVGLNVSVSGGTGANNAIVVPASGGVVLIGKNTSNGSNNLLQVANNVSWGTSGQGTLVSSGNDAYIDASVASGGLIFRTNGSTTALTLSSAQLATFAGAVTVTGTTTLNGAIAAADGANKSVGVSAAMTAGTITISNTRVTANSRIFLTHATLGGVQGILSVGTISAGTSFVINSSSAADTGTVNWLIIN